MALKWCLKQIIFTVQCWQSFAFQYVLLLYDEVWVSFAPNQSSSDRAFIPKNNHSMWLPNCTQSGILLFLPVSVSPRPSGVATILGLPANNLFGPLATGLRRLLLPGGPCGSLQSRASPRGRGACGALATPLPRPCFEIGRKQHQLP